MIGFPFDSHVTYETDGTPVYDRAISSEPLRKLLHKLFTDGILPDVSTNLQVVASSGMNIVVKAGFAIVQGCLKLEENDRTLALQASSATNDRIDTVVLRLNSNDDQRYCDLYIREGTPATNPIRPNLVRSDSVYELGLADIFVSKTITSITQSKITDTRYEAERCGVISSLSEYDTTTIYSQVQADLKEFKATEQAEFLAWYENIKNILDESTAGNLLEKINKNASDIQTNKDNISKNATDIQNVSSKESSNATSITNLTTKVDTNATNISTNTSSINSLKSSKQDKAIKTTITLSTSWSSLTQSVSVSGITANHNAILDVVTSTSNYEAQQTEWAKVYKAETYNGGIKFYAKEATSTALTIQVLAM